MSEVPLSNLNVKRAGAGVGVQPADHRKMPTTIFQLANLIPKRV